MNNQWWRDPGMVHLLVDMALKLDERYAGQPLLGVGHTPSWLMVAAKMIRDTRDGPTAARTAVLPFSGQSVALDRDLMMPSVKLEDNPVITYKPDTYTTATPGAQARYFNYIARRGLAPAQMLSDDALAKNGRPVLVDLIHKGNGFASFIGLYNKDFEEQRVDIHAYKRNNHLTRARFAIPGLTLADAEDVRLYDVTLESGAAGFAADQMAGNFRVPDSWQKDDNEPGRFMPYYRLNDKRRPGSLFSDREDPASGFSLPQKGKGPQVKDIRQALRTAVAATFADPAAHKAVADDYAQTLLKQDRKALNPQGWVPFYGGFHGGF